VNDKQLVEQNATTTIKHTILARCGDDFSFILIDSDDESHFIPSDLRCRLPACRRGCLADGRVSDEDKLGFIFEIGGRWVVDLIMSKRCELYVFGEG